MSDDDTATEELLSAAVAEMDGAEDNAGAGSEPAEGDAQPLGGPGDGDDQGDDNPNPNHEAAKWRTRLRESQAVEAGVSSRLEAAQRQLAERAATEYLHDSADLWRGGVTLEELMSVEGDIDPRLVEQAARRVVGDHPHWGRGATTVDADQGQRGGPPPAGWSTMFGAHAKG